MRKIKMKEEEERRKRKEEEEGGARKRKGKGGPTQVTTYPVLEQHQRWRGRAPCFSSHPMGACEGGAEGLMCAAVAAGVLQPSPCITMSAHSGEQEALFSRQRLCGSSCQWIT